MSGVPRCAAAPVVTDLQIGATPADFGIGVASAGRDVVHVIFHFKFSGAHGWEAMGSGEGAGSEALPLAIADLRSLHGGRLPAGRYQYIAAFGGETRWIGFELGEAGEVVG